MAHEIHLATNIDQVVNKDVTLVIKTGPKDNLKKLGSLLISKGNVEWLPAGNHVNKFQIGWAELAALLEKEGKAVKAK